MLPLPFVPEADGVGWILGSGPRFICNETCVPCAWNTGFFDDTNGVLVLRIDNVNHHCTFHTPDYVTCETTWTGTWVRLP